MWEKFIKTFVFYILFKAQNWQNCLWMIAIFKYITKVKEKTRYKYTYIHDTIHIHSYFIHTYKRGNIHTYIHTYKQTDIQNSAKLRASRQCWVCDPALETLGWDSSKVNALEDCWGPWKKQGVCHTVALPFTLKKYLNAKEELWKYENMNYENSSISPCKNHTKSSKKILYRKETKILQDIIILLLNLKFQHKPKYHLSKILT